MWTGDILREIGYRIDSKWRTGRDFWTYHKVKNKGRDK